jgi:PAS domain S-box-containing protein
MKIDQKSDYVYDSIFESGLEAIIIANSDDLIIAANPKSEKILGYSEAELCNMELYDIVDLNSNFLKERELKGNASSELTFSRKNHEKFIGLVSSHIFIDEQGNKRISMIIRDLNELKNEQLNLQKSEKRYYNLFNNMMEGYAYCKMLFDENGQPVDWIYLEVNKSFEKLTGLKNITGKRVTEAIPQVKELEPELFETYGRVALTGHPENLELYFKPLKIWLKISVYMPEMEHFVAVFENVTKRKNAEEKLKKNQKKYHNLFENAQIGIFRAKINKPEILEVNQKIIEMSGYNKEELLSADNLNRWLDPEELQEIMTELITNGFVTDKEVSMITKSGKERIVLVSFKLYPEEEYFEGTILDLTKRKQLEEQVKKSLQEKNMLLKEIHHRVKNNLMIISSLLNLQSSYIKDKQALDVFTESQNRARSMALIHEKLYKSTDLKRIDFGEYINSLSRELVHTYSSNSCIIKLKTNVEPISLDINTAVPLGLIINELVTNSLTHAFPESKLGEINVDFHSKDNHYEFIIKDNGIGFPEDLDFRNTDSLGLQMVTNLTNQIDGEIELNNSKGTEFKIKFQELTYEISI